MFRRLLLGWGRARDRGRGRMGGNRPGAGPAGECLCPKCGYRVAHQRAQPCYKQSCPRCGTRMVRG
jgi:uncharacterized paraquat-inducible protein A